MTQRCPHDGEICPSECPNVCARLRHGRARPAPYFGFPQPGEAPLMSFSPQTLQTLADSWEAAAKDLAAQRDALQAEVASLQQQCHDTANKAQAYGIDAYLLRAAVNRARRALNSGDPAGCDRELKAALARPKPTIKP